MLFWTITKADDGVDFPALYIFASKASGMCFEIERYFKSNLIRSLILQTSKAESYNCQIGKFYRFLFIKEVNELPNKLPY